jgi:putative SOS response-associated peptidase YedK
LTYSKAHLAERFQASDESGEIEDRPRYNVAPTQPVVTVRKEQGKKTRHFTTMRWGLIPSWAKDMSIGSRTLNARSETVTSTPAFRLSILTKRCLIPADGFYEWRKMGSVKQPYCFEVGDRELFAGLWDEWTSRRRGHRKLHDFNNRPKFPRRRLAQPHARDSGTGQIRPLA